MDFREVLAEVESEIGEILEQRVSSSDHSLILCEKHLHFRTLLIGPEKAIELAYDRLFDIKALLNSNLEKYQVLLAH